MNMRNPMVCWLSCAIAIALFLLSSCSKELVPGPELPVEIDDEIDQVIMSYPATVRAGTASEWSGLSSAEDEVDNDLAGEVDTTIVDGIQYVCTEHERHYSTVNSTFPLIDENSDVIWPGAVLQGKSLYRATPDPITAPRGSGDLIWTQINGSRLSSVSISVITYAAVKSAADSLLAAQPTAVPADISISIKRVRTKEELQIAVDASTSFFGLWGSSFHFDESLEEGRSYYLIAIKQNLFTLVFERPGLPHQFFAPCVDLADIAPHVGADNPPAYVSRVTYGRQFYLLVSSLESHEEMEGTLNANFNLGLFGTSVGAKTDYFTSFSGVDTDLYVYGGDATGFEDALAELDALKAFKNALKNGQDFALAKPVYATIRSVKDDVLLENGYTLGYTYRDCRSVALCAPILLTPGPNAKNVDNGCRCDNNSIRWNFTWSGNCRATEYEIQISHPAYGILSQRVTGTTYTKTWNVKYLEDTEDWNWRVCSITPAGDQGPWSEWRSFDLERVDYDCRTGIWLYADLNYTGSNRFLDAYDDGFTIPDLRPHGMNDKVTSFILYNLKCATLYEHLNGGGAHHTFDENCPDLRPYGFNDKVTSLTMQRCQ